MGRKQVQSFSRRAGREALHKAGKSSDGWRLSLLPGTAPVFILRISFPR